MSFGKFPFSLFYLLGINSQLPLCFTVMYNQQLQGTTDRGAFLLFISMIPCEIIVLLYCQRSELTSFLTDTKRHLLPVTLAADAGVWSVWIV